MNNVDKILSKYCINTVKYSTHAWFKFPHSHRCRIMGHHLHFAPRSFRGRVREEVLGSEVSHAPLLDSDGDGGMDGGGQGDEDDEEEGD